MSYLKEIENLTNLIKEDPTNFQARRELTIALMDKGFNEEAIKQLSYLITIFPEDARLHYNLGIAWDKLHNFKQAQKAYETALSYEPDEPDFLYNLGYLYLEMEENEKAIHYFMKVIEKDSLDGNCFFNLGVCYRNIKDSEKAIDFFLKALELNEKDILASFYLACEYQKIGEEQKAQIQYAEVIKNCPDYSWAYFNLASMAYKEKNYEKTIEYLEKTLELNPKDIDAYKIYAQVLTILGETIKAEEIILKALNYNPYCGDLYYYLAKLAQKNNDIEEYIERLQQAIENEETLSFPIKAVKNELKKVQKE